MGSFLLVHAFSSMPGGCRGTNAFVVVRYALRRECLYQSIFESRRHSAVYGTVVQCPGHHDRPLDPGHGFFGESDGIFGTDECRLESRCPFVEVCSHPGAEAVSLFTECKCAEQANALP